MFGKRKYRSVYRFTRQTISWFVSISFFLCLFSTGIDSEKSVVQLANGLVIQLDQFSPAYAAMEDDYLFEFEETLKTVQLLAGKSNELFKSLTQKAVVPFLALNPFTFSVNEKMGQATQSLDSEKTAKKEPKLKNNFKSFATTKFNAVDIKTQIDTSAIKITTPEILASNPIETKTIVPNIQVSFGPMASAVPVSKQSSPRFPFAHSSWPTKKSNPNFPKQPDLGHPLNDSKDLSPEDNSGYFKVSGPLELAGGLAFLGKMEISWFQDGVERRRGYISVSDGSYNISTEALRGEIVASLYDEDDYLIGEGRLRLKDLKKLKHQRIEVRPIDVALAGKVVSQYSVAGNDEPVEGAVVSLFGLEEEAQTNSKGEYRFEQWKTAFSKTIALASKNGYWDSIYLIDSNRENQVLLIPNDYMQAMFSTLVDQGFSDEIKKQGVVWGVITNDDVPVQGAKVRIEGYDSVYFNSYFAMKNQKATDASGQFTLVGLTNGDHELVVEYQGEEIDRHILVVEEGKVSPVLIDIKKRNKTLKFIDPLFPNEKLDQTAVRFFDGEYAHVNSAGKVAQKTTQSDSPLLLEYSHKNGSDNNMFIDRATNFGQIPALNSQWLDKLGEKYDLDISKGLAIGFVQGAVPFNISVAEGEPEKLLYFDKSGAIIGPESPSFAPQGFIISGIHQGLHTIICKNKRDDSLIFTDLLYNDHESVSVVYKNFTR